MNQLYYGANLQVLRKHFNWVRGGRSAKVELVRLNPANQSAFRFKSVERAFVCDAVLAIKQVQQLLALPIAHFRQFQAARQRGALGGENFSGGIIIMGDREGVEFHRHGLNLRPENSRGARPQSMRRASRLRAGVRAGRATFKKAKAESDSEQQTLI